MAEFPLLGIKPSSDGKDGELRTVVHFRLMKDIVENPHDWRHMEVMHQGGQQQSNNSGVDGTAFRTTMFLYGSSG